MTHNYGDALLQNIRDELGHSIKEQDLLAVIQRWKDARTPGKRRVWGIYQDDLTKEEIAITNLALKDLEVHE
jgi:hypothetical protein